MGDVSRPAPLWSADIGSAALRVELDMPRQFPSVKAAMVGNLARLGMLPRTRPIVPGELAVSD